MTGPLGDAGFVAAFESCTLPAEQFHHRDHVRLAFLYLRQAPPLEALGRFAEGLKRYAASLGVTTLYHETITWAYLLLIHERMARGPASDFETFAAANEDLLARHPSVLERYYLPETLASDLARRTFLLPDAR